MVQHGPPEDLGEDKLSDDFSPDKASLPEGEEYDDVVVGSDLGGAMLAVLPAIDCFFPRKIASTCALPSGLLPSLQRVLLWGHRDGNGGDVFNFD